MPRVIFVDDEPDNILALLGSIATGDYLLCVDDVEGWCVNASDIEKTSLDGHSNLYEIGFIVAMSEISKTDAELLIVDLNYEDDINNLIRDKNLADEALLSKKIKGNDSYGGALIIHHYLGRSSMKSDDKVIVASDTHSCVKNLLSSYHNKTHGCGYEDLIAKINEIYPVNIEARIWPDYTNDWYKDNTSDVPHNESAFQITGKRDSAKDWIMTYLNRLFGDNLPNTWLDSNNRFEFFWEDLRYMVGKKAICSCGYDDANDEPHEEYGEGALTLGNIILLLAVASKDATSDMPEWFNNIQWEESYKGVEILPKNQTKEQAVNAVKVLINGKGDGLFENIQIKEGTKKELLVKGVVIGDSSLSINLAFNVSDRSTHKPNNLSMLEKFETLNIPGEGKLYKAFTRFLRDSAVTRRGYEPRCAVKLYYKKDVRLSILEIRTLRP